MRDSIIPALLAAAVLSGCASHQSASEPAGGQKSVVDLQAELLNRSDRTHLVDNGVTLYDMTAIGESEVTALAGNGCPGTWTSVTGTPAQDLMAVALAPIISSRTDEAMAVGPMPTAGAQAYLCQPQTLEQLSVIQPWALATYPTMDGRAAVVISSVQFQPFIDRWSRQVADAKLAMAMLADDAGRAREVVESGRLRAEPADLGHTLSQALSRGHIELARALRSAGAELTLTQILEQDLIGQANRHGQTKSLNRWLSWSNVEHSADLRNAILAEARSEGLLEGEELSRNLVVYETWALPTYKDADRDGARYLALVQQLARKQGYQGAGQTLTPAEIEHRYRHFARKARGGDEDAQFSLALMYHHGQYEARDWDKATVLYRSAAAKGHAPAANNLGLILSDRGTRHYRPDAAAALFRQAAEAGEANGQYNLAMAYLRGTGVPADPAKARYWLERAAGQDDMDAAVALAGMVRAGEGGPRDPAQAVALLDQAAAAGHPAARRELTASDSESGAIAGAE